MNPQNDTHGQAGRSDLWRSAAKAQECGSSDNSAASQSSMCQKCNGNGQRIQPVLVGRAMCCMSIPCRDCRGTGNAKD